MALLNAQKGPWPDLPVLYSFRRCPYAMRARLALLASGVTVHLREVVLRDKPPDMVAASPKATVPVLVLADGTVIDESDDIMRWALGRNDPDGWLPADPDARHAIDELVAGNDGAFKAALDRYKYPNRYPDEAIDPVAQRDSAARWLMGHEARLAEGGWLVGDAMTFADAATLPFVRQYANVDRAWFDARPWPHLIAWLDRFTASARFAAIMGKHPAWRRGDEPVLFPASPDRP